ncbi:MAG: ankyrin repeat domain-containing protein [Holosporaceae bacterium]|nr:ankyrin repeat domain-containing protein [Holosporaceae bacterium]
MEKNLHFIWLSILPCVIFDASASEYRGNLKRITSDFNVTDVSSSAEQESVYRKINVFCNNNKIRPKYYDFPELIFLKNLCSLTRKIGYQKRKVGGKEYYVIDISWPSIKAYAEKLAAKQPVGSPLGKLLEKIGKVFHNQQINKNAKNELLCECHNIFNLGKLRLNKRLQFVEILKGVLDNYSGFQRIASILVVGLLNSGKDGFVKNFTEIKVERRNDDESSAFSFYQKTIYLKDRYYDPEAQKTAERVFMHELTHAFHSMIVSNESYTPFYRNLIPFFVQSAISNDNFCDMFFPMLTKQNLIAKNNPILNAIRTALINNERKVNEVIRDVVGISRGGKSSTRIAETLFVTLKAIVENGFGEAVLGGSWERSLAETLNVESLARAIYVRALIFSEINGMGCVIEKIYKAHHISPENTLMVNCRDNEEILTIFGMLVFLLRGKFILLEDRQNEQIFEWRELPMDKDTELEAGIYDVHTSNPSLYIVKSFLSGFLEEITRDVLINERLYFTKKNLENILFPKELVHKKAYFGNTGRTDVITYSVEGSDDPLELTLSLLKSIKAGTESSTPSKLTPSPASPPNVTTKTEDASLAQTVQLFNAALKGYAEMAKSLIQNGANVRAQDKYGQTPLHYAAGSGNNDIANLLIQRGASMEVRDKYGQTPLFKAVINRKQETARLLIQNGANVKAQDNTGRIPIDYHICQSW